MTAQDRGDVVGLHEFEGYVRDLWARCDGLAPAAHGPFAEAARIGRYRVVRELGRGGQGVVLLADDVVLNRPVALKVLTAWGRLGPDLLARLRREAELAAKLDHPGLATVYDFGEDAGTPFLAMRYVDGVTLEQHLVAARAAARPLDLTAAAPARSPLSRIVEVIEEVARALHSAHLLGIVHRDVKPGNIVLTPEGRPVLLDFGIAADLDGELPTLTRTGDRFGTPAYMAVEQISGERRADARTDVYALGVTLYECLTLRRPFEAATREGLFAAVRRGGAADVRRCCPAAGADLALVVATAMQTEADRRYASALDFADDLRRVRRREPIRARRAGPLLRARRWLQRNPSLAAGAALALLSIAAVLAWSSYLAGVARAERREGTRLADLERVRVLRQQADRLWPPHPERLGGDDGIDAWLARAGGLLASRADHRRARDQLRRAGSGDLDAFRLQAVTELLASLDELESVVADVAARREFAAALERRTVVDPAAAWRDAADHAARHPAYAGLRLTPQIGLVPLGADPESRLLEFAHLQSGRVPARDERSGRLTLDEASAIVLVLLPGGTFRMGATRIEGQPNHDPLASADAGPVHEVTLEPFFLARHEMTQAQWLRIMGDNPSSLRPGTVHAGRTITPLHPVEQVSWNDAIEATGRMGLVLPTEAQWEYACRAGTATIYSTGDDVASLRGHANILDEGSGGLAPVGRAPQPGFFDGYLYHAPVGSFAPNAFGLHDMHGNVWELCLDWYAEDYRLPVRSGDGLRLVPEAARLFVVNRSSSFDFDALLARCALRNKSMPDHRYYSLGLRPTRALAR